MTTPPETLTLADVKAHLRITTSANDVRLQGFLDAALPLVESYVGAVTPVTLTQLYDGGGAWLVLRTVPVISVSSIAVYAGGSATMLVGATDPSLEVANTYTVDNDTGVVISRTTGGQILPFPAGVGNIVVTYTAGRVLLPPTLRLAVLELVRHLWGPQRGPWLKPDDGDDAESAMPTSYAVPNRVVELLKPFRLGPRVR